MDALVPPLSGSIFYEDEYVYACLATHPIVKGHSIVVWKEKRDDLSNLSQTEYQQLMGVVDKVRNTLINSLAVEKVYLVYMDEVKHVHWHLVPRYNEEGFTMLTHEPGLLTDITLAESFRKIFQRTS